jgi:hypothetical protein
LLDTNVLISGDADFTSLEMEHPEILTPKAFAVGFFCIAPRVNEHIGNGFLSEQMQRLFVSKLSSDSGVICERLPPIETLDFSG